MDVAGVSTEPPHPLPSSSFSGDEESRLNTDEVVFLEFSPRVSLSSSRACMDLSAPRRKNAEDCQGESRIRGVGF